MRCSCDGEALIIRAGRGRANAGTAVHLPEPPARFIMPPMTLAPISALTAEHYTWGGVCDGWHLVRAPGLSVIQERVPPGGQEIRHYHQQARQFFFVLAGAVVLEVAGTPHPLAALTGLEVPPGVPHQLFNQSDADAVFLVISQPPTAGDRVAVDPA
jgi:mannose-6-phosphate isomerase-like protein (cupin superfamily)